LIDVSQENQKTYVRSRDELSREYECSKSRQLSIVHPTMVELVAKQPWTILRELKDSRDAGLISENEFRIKIAELASRG